MAPKKTSSSQASEAPEEAGVLGAALLESRIDAAGVDRYTRRPSGRIGDTRERHRVSVKMTGISPDPQKTTSLDNP